MGLRNRLRAVALPDPVHRRAALDRFTSVAEPITYPELMAEQHRLDVAKRREAREAGDMMRATGAAWLPDEAN